MGTGQHSQWDERGGRDGGSTVEAQAGGSASGDTHTGQRAKWVRLMMLLRLRERPQLLGGLQVLTRKGIDAMCKAYNEKEKEEERHQ